VSTEVLPTAGRSPDEGQSVPDAHPFAGAGELSVDLVLEQVVARNPSLAQMTAAWQAAAARYPQVTALDDPMLGTMVAPASIGSNNVEFGFRVEVSQKIPYPGKRALRGESARTEADAAGRDVEDMRLQLVEGARTAFYEYFQVSRAAAVNEEGLRLLEDFRERARERYEKVPGAAQQDILQAEVEIGRQRQRGLVIERMRKVAVARLNTLMHIPPDAPLPPPPTSLVVAGELPRAEQLRAQAVASRPDLQAQADRIRADEAALALARKEFCPDFEVSAAYDSIMGNGPMRDLAPQVGARLNLPVRRDRRYAALAEAQARLAQRQAELAKQIDQVNFQVQESYEQVLEGEKTVRLYEQTLLPAAEANVKAARSSYETGKIPFISLIEAQRNVVELRDRYYEAVADYFRRRSTLERAVGAPAQSGEPGAARSGPR
jgi:outer membrane protein TolC